MPSQQDNNQQHYHTAHEEREGFEPIPRTGKGIQRRRCFSLSTNIIRVYVVYTNKIAEARRCLTCYLDKLITFLQCFGAVGWVIRPISNVVKNIVKISK